ncbi:MAG: amidase [Novosphingobium sp.]
MTGLAPASGDNLARHRSILVGGRLAIGSGIPIVVKDSIDIAGEVTAAGSRALAGHPRASEHAEVVARLLARGFQIAGKANMHELAFGVTGVNAWTGTPLNPYYPTLAPGGSSSGSAAAVAAGMVTAAIGTDTGGSIRVPAACCGIIGLKPTFGRVSRRGASPEVSSLDCIGPLALDLATIEAVMAAIAPDWQSDRSRTDRITLGLVETGADPAIAAHVFAAAAGARAVPVSLPLFAQAHLAGLDLIGHETAAAFAHLCSSGLVGADVRVRIEAGLAVTPAQIAAAQEVRAAFRASVDAALAHVDLLFLPTLPVPPPLLEEAGDATKVVPITANCRPFNLSGHPALTVPVGEVAGRPVSAQLVGPMYGDERLCHLAARLFG